MITGEFWLERYVGSTRQEQEERESRIPYLLGPLSYWLRIANRSNRYLFTYFVYLGVKNRTCHDPSSSYAFFSARRIPSLSLSLSLTFPGFSGGTIYKIITSVCDLGIWDL